MHLTPFLKAIFIDLPENLKSVDLLSKMPANNCEKRKSGGDTTLKFHSEILTLSIFFPF